MTSKFESHLQEVSTRLLLGNLSGHNDKIIPFNCGFNFYNALTLSLLHSLDFKIGYNDDEQDKVMVVNYANYCRFCAALKRVELVQDSWASNPFMRTLGIFTVPHRNTRIMFVKDEFDHPTLGENEKLCDHLGEYQSLGLIKLFVFRGAASQKNQCLVHRPDASWRQQKQLPPFTLWCL